MGNLPEGMKSRMNKAETIGWGLEDNYCIYLV